MCLNCCFFFGRPIKKWWDSVIAWCQQHVNSASQTTSPLAVQTLPTSNGWSQMQSAATQTPKDWTLGNTWNEPHVPGSHETKFRKLFFLGGRPKGRWINIVSQFLDYFPLKHDCWTKKRKNKQKQLELWSWSWFNTWRPVKVESGRWFSGREDFVYVIVSQRACRSWDMGKSSRTKLQKHDISPWNYNISPEK